MLGEFSDEEIKIIKNKYINVGNFLKFYIKDDHLFINSISRSEKLSGTEIMKKIEKINVKSISLYDDSTLLLFDSNKEDFSCRLSILYILSNGQSWYNNLGYYQENFNRNKYNKIINSNFYETLLSIKKFNYSFDELFDLKRIFKIINKRKENDNDEVLRFCFNYIFSKQLDRTATCKEVGLFLKLNRYNKEDSSIYFIIIILSLFEHLFDYPREIKLIKHI